MSPTQYDAIVIAAGPASARIPTIACFPRMGRERPSHAVCMRCAMDWRLQVLRFD